METKGDPEVLQLEHLTVDLIVDCPYVFAQLLETIRSDSFRGFALCLPEQHINDCQAAELAEAVKMNSYIREVKLRGNMIGDAGAKCLAKLSLEVLDLSYNFSRYRRSVLFIEGEDKTVGLVR